MSVARGLVLVVLVSCRAGGSPVPVVAKVSPTPQSVVASAGKPTGDREASTAVFDVRDVKTGTKPIVAGAPAWPEDPSPTIDVVIHLYGMNAELKQDVEVVARIGSISRRVMTRQMGSTRMGILCPDASNKDPSASSSPDDRLPRGELLTFSAARSEPQWVSWISFVIGGATTLTVLRAKADSLVVQTSERPDGMCPDESDCTSTRTLAVIPIPPGAKTRGRVVEGDGDGEIPFTFCPSAD